MNGITVLAEKTGCDVLGIVLASLFILSSIAFLVIGISDLVNGQWIGILALIVALAVLPVSIYGLLDSISPKRVLKITVSDEVKLNEFLDRYEILEVDGEIYTVRVKK